MAKIVAEGLTFDDVLYIPRYYPKTWTYRPNLPIS